MNRLVGTGTLEYQGVPKQVQVSLDLDKNVIEVQHAMPDFKEVILSFNKMVKNDSLADLSDLNITTPIGILTKDSLKNLLVTSYNPGTYSIYDATLTRVLGFREKGEGLSKILLRPSNLWVEFDFCPFESLAPQFELFYRGAINATFMPINLQLSTGRAKVMCNNGGFIVRGEQALSKQKKLIQLSLGILQGGPMTLRCIIEQNQLMVNFSTHHGRSIGSLYKKYEDAEVLLQSIYNFLSTLTPTKWARWSRGIHFFLLGLGGIAPLEIRIINLFTCLEIIDDRNTLDKNSVATLLNVTTDEADLLCRTRNRLIHHGDDIGAAVLESEKKISRFKGSLNNTVFNIYQSDKIKTGNSFFFRFAMLLNRLWVSKVEYKGDWNDYLENGLEGNY